MGNDHLGCDPVARIVMADLSGADDVTTRLEPGFL
jgi:hypothetical protein